MKRWLSVPGNRKGILADQLIIVLNEMDNNYIALKGNSVYSITYTSVANVSNL